MKYLIFSKLNRNHFFFLSYFIISIIKDIVNRYIGFGKDLIFSFNRYYIITLSDFLSIIPLIIIKVRSKSISKENQESLTNNRTESNNNIKYIYTDINEKRKKRILKLSILISIIDFVALYSNVTFDIIIQTFKIVIKTVKINSHILINIISIFILNNLILHLPIYKHHYLSLAINLIFLIGLIIYDILLIKEANTYFYVLKKILIGFLYSIEDVYSKILLSIDSVSPYTYLLYRGIFRNILSLFYSLVFIFVKIPDENGIKSCVFSRFWKVYENKLNILLYILFLFIGYLFNLNIYLIIDKFSPIHYAVATIFGNFGSLLILIFYGNIKIGEFFIKFAIYFILILAALIYNEFIVLNFCGFQKNTYLFLQKKENEDLEQINIDNNENDLFSEEENNKNENINTDEKINNESLEPNLIENKEQNLIENIEPNLIEYKEQNVSK